MKQHHLIVVGLGTAALLLAGCGSSASTSSASSTPSAGATAGASTGAAAAPGTNGTDFAKFQDCLKQHGVTSTQGIFGFRRDQQGGTPNAAPTSRPTMDAKTQAAITACRSLLPQGGFGGERRLTSSPQFAAFKTCMQDHGVTISIPSADTTTGNAQPSPSAGAAGRGFLGLDLTNPKTKAAYDTCKVLLPNGGSFGGSGQAPSGQLAPVPSASASTNA